MANLEIRLTETAYLDVSIAIPNKFARAFLYLGMRFHFYIFVPIGTR